MNEYVMNGEPVWGMFISKSWSVGTNRNMTILNPENGTVFSFSIFIFFLEALELFVIVSVQKIVLLWQCHTFFLLLLFLLSLWPASLVPCSKAVPFPHAFHNILLNVSPSLKPFSPLYGIFSSFLNYIHTQNHIYTQI